MSGVWRDPVGSKLIAEAVKWAVVGICASAGLTGLAAVFIDSVSNWLAVEFLVRRWLLLILMLVSACSVAALTIALPRRRVAPLEPVEPSVNPEPRVAKPFDQLSQQQKTYLQNQYGRGTRQFTERAATTQLRWFEELSNWRYIAYVDVPMVLLGGPLPYEITEEGWSELESVL